VGATVILNCVRARGYEISCSSEGCVGQQINGSGDQFAVCYRLYGFIPRRTCRCVRRQMLDKKLADGSTALSDNWHGQLSLRSFRALASD